MAEPHHDWRQALREQEGDPGPHRSEETLAAYRAGELSAAEDEAVQAHLVGCRLCSRILLELAEGPEALPSFEESSAAAAPDWAPLRAELAKDGWFEEPRRELSAPKVSWWRQLLSPPRWAYAGFAAVLLVTTIFFVIPSQAVVRLEETTRSAGIQEVRISRWVRKVVFVVPATQLPDSPDLQIRLLGPEEQTIFKQHGLRPQSDGTFLVVVRRRELTEGNYVLELEALEPDHAEPIDRFSFLLKGGS